MEESAVISTSTDGATLVAAKAGMRICVEQYYLTGEGTVTVTFKSNTTALTGAMGVVANGTLGAALSSSAGWRSWLFRTAAGEALLVGLSAAVGVRGHLKYHLEPAT